jgi:hypothetical protein
MIHASGPPCSKDYRGTYVENLCAAKSPRLVNSMHFAPPIFFVFFFFLLGAQAWMTFWTDLDFRVDRTPVSTPWSQHRDLSSLIRSIIPSISPFHGYLPRSFSFEWHSGNRNLGLGSASIEHDRGKVNTPRPGGLAGVSHCAEGGRVGRHSPGSMRRPFTVLRSIRADLRRNCARFVCRSRGKSARTLWMWPPNHCRRFTL